MTAADRIADFVVRFPVSPITPAVERAVRRSLVDTLAVALAGRFEPASQIAAAYGRGHSGPLMASIWTGGEDLPVELAALINGITAHALDYDDVSSPMRGHPSVAIWPAILALGQAHGATFANMVSAYVVGFEVIGCLAEAMAQPHYAKGWHTSSTIGIFGATAAAAHLCRLSHKQVCSALGIAVSQAAGTLENFGYMAKPFQVGHAGAAAIRSVALAARGFTASATALDGARGFLSLYADQPGLPLDPAPAEGAPLRLEAIGIEIKKYPMCYAAHRAIDGILDLCAQVPDLTLDAVESVAVGSSRDAFVPLIHEAPGNGLEAKFSLNYAIAAALCDGGVKFLSFTDEAVNRPEIRDFLPKVHRLASDGHGSVLPRWTELQLTLKDGRSITRRVDALRGSAQNPLSDGELRDKVADCLNFGGFSERAEQICGLLDVELATDVPTLLTKVLS